MFVKEIEGIGVPAPSECKHLNLEKYEGGAICEDCCAILHAKDEKIDEPTETKEASYIPLMENVELPTWDYMEDSSEDPDE